MGKKCDVKIDFIFIGGLCRFRLRVVRIFPQGLQSEQNASARENHPTRYKGEMRREDRKNEHRRVSPFSRGVISMRAGLFALYTIPEEKWGLLVV